jgi:hypothetical protein
MLKDATTHPMMRGVTMSGMGPYRVDQGRSGITSMFGLEIVGIMARLYLMAVTVYGASSRL